MSYTRVVPRDLFNEAKLLKCLGQLALLIHDHRVHSTLRMSHSYGPFMIEQREHDAGLYVSDGIEFFAGCRKLDLYTKYNSKEPYPLYCDFGDDEVQVLEPEGFLSQEFWEMLDDADLSPAG